MVREQLKCGGLTLFLNNWTMFIVNGQNYDGGTFRRNDGAVFQQSERCDWGALGEQVTWRGHPCRVSSVWGWFSRVRK